MSQHHFLIKYDNSIKEWEWDVDTEITRFNRETIYLPQDDKWVTPQHNNSIMELDNDLSESVGSAINYLNKKEGTR